MLLNNPGWPQTHYSPDADSQMLEQQVLCGQFFLSELMVAVLLPEPMVPVFLLQLMVLVLLTAMGPSSQTVTCYKEPHRKTWNDCAGKSSFP